MSVPPDEVVVLPAECPTTVDLAVVFAQVRFASTPIAVVFAGNVPLKFNALPTTMPLIKQVEAK